MKSFGRTIIYARYSTEKQDGKSIDAQIANVTPWVEQNDGRVGLALTDRAVSGASWKTRRDFQRLLEEIDAGRWDTVAVDDFKRLGRDEEGLHHLRKRLVFRGVRLVAKEDGYDTEHDPQGLMFSQHAVMSAQGRHAVAVNTRRQLAFKASVGKPTGAPPYGFAIKRTRNTDGEVIDRAYEIIPEQAATVRWIFEEYAAGTPFTNIARNLNERKIVPPRKPERGWRKGTVRAILQNERYAGVWRYGERKWVKNPESEKRVKQKGTAPVQVWHAPAELIVVPRELFDRAQRTFKGRKQQSNRPRGEYPLSGLLVCGQCGSRMNIYGKGKWRRYRCSTNDSAGDQICSNTLTVLESEARTKIFDAVRDAVSKPNYLAFLRRRVVELMAEQRKGRKDRIASAKRDLGKAQSRAERAANAMIAQGHSPTLGRLLEEAERDVRDAQAQLDLVSVEQADEVPQLPTDQDIRDRVLALNQMADERPAALREALRTLFKGSCVTLTPMPDKGVYEARAELLPAVLLLNAKTPESDPGGLSSLLNSDGCGGRI